jgi:hypothetical protein
MDFLADLHGAADTPDHILNHNQNTLIIEKCKVLLQKRISYYDPKQQYKKHQQSDIKY